MGNPWSSLLISTSTMNYSCPLPLKGPRRVAEELRDEDGVVTLRLIDNNWNHIEGSFPGPTATPFEGGTFIVEFKLPLIYPFSAPQVTFKTLVWHPNISPNTGAMCDEFLTDWAAGLRIRKICIFLQSLLASPDMNSPISDAAARQFLHNPKAYEETVKYWTAAYASGPAVTDKLNAKVVDAVVKLDMSVDDARLYLSICDWDVNKVDLGRYPEGDQELTQGSNIPSTFPLEEEGSTALDSCLLALSTLSNSPLPLPVVSSGSGSDSDQATYSYDNDDEEDTQTLNSDGEDSDPHGFFMI